MIERTRDASWATVAAFSAVGAATYVYLTFGFEAVGAFGAIAAIGASVWIVVYLALGEGEDDPRDVLLDEALRLLDPLYRAGMSPDERAQRYARWGIEFQLYRGGR